MAHLCKVSSSRTIPIVEGWEIAATEPGAIENPSELDGATHFFPAIVPGTAASAMRAVGTWNFDKPRDFDASDWWYRTRFPYEPGASGDDKIVRLLRFEGLATVAEVWLNGSKVIETDNMFRAYELDVGSLLGAENELAIRFRAITPLLKVRRGRPRWRTKLVGDQQLRWFRTTLLGRIPGWTPPVAPVGPWRPVVLEERRIVSIERASVRASLEGEDGRVVVSIHGRMLAKDDPDRPEIRAGDQRGSLTFKRNADGSFVMRGEVRVSGAKPWFPHTHGEPALYPVAIDFRAGGTDVSIDCGKVGFRTIELAAGGGAFELFVNDVPVFCRGACWTTTDIATLGGRAADYAAALDTVRAGGMNMIRVGGTMVYEANAFYEACDERGIMVWQDFMFANMDYPADDDAFCANVTAEARETLERLESRPSLAVLCGNSEIEQQVAMLGLSRELWRPRLFYETLRDIARAVRGDVPYVPSTPTGGTLPFAVDTGISHYYGVGAYLRPLEDARRARVRFTPECLGFSNIPDDATIDLVIGSGESPAHHPRWKARVPRDSGPGWDFEDVRDHYLERLYGVDPASVRYSDVQRYLALGRVTTGEVMAATFAEWRRPESTCRGALIWFFRDLWPGAGWGVVDASGAPKAAYYYVKRAAKSVCVLVSDEGLNGLDIHVINELPARLDAEIRVALYRDGEALVASGSQSECVPARGTASLRTDELLSSFYDVTYAYRFGPPSHDVTVVTLVCSVSGTTLHQAFHFPRGLGVFAPTELGLEASIVRTEAGDHAVLLRTRKFAQSVAITVEGAIAEDNYFHMAPASERTVALVVKSGQTRLQGSVQALNGRGAIRLVLAEGRERTT